MRADQLRSSWMLLCFAPLVGVGGCSGDGTTIESTVNAKGKVTYKGQPLEFHQVMLYPDGHRVASGVTDKDGNFVLGTNAPEDGAVAGAHKVSVHYQGPPVDPTIDVSMAPPPPPPKVKIPAKFNKPETSGLSVTIPEDGTSDLSIELQ